MNSYDLEMEKYKNAGIDGFILRNAHEVKAVLGFDLRTIRGYGSLPEEGKKLAEKLICNFICMSGLEHRQKKRPSAISPDVKNKRFKLSLKKGGYSWLYFDGSVG